MKFIPVILLVVGFLFLFSCEDKMDRRNKIERSISVEKQKQVLIEEFLHDCLVEKGEKLKHIRGFHHPVTYHKVSKVTDSFDSFEYYSIKEWLVHGVVISYDSMYNYQYNFCRDTMWLSKGKIYSPPKID